MNYCFRRRSSPKRCILRERTLQMKRGRGTTTPTPFPLPNSDKDIDFFVWLGWQQRKHGLLGSWMHPNCTQILQLCPNSKLDRGVSSQRRRDFLLLSLSHRYVISRRGTLVKKVCEKASGEVGRHAFCTRRDGWSRRQTLWGAVLR